MHRWNTTTSRASLLIKCLQWSNIVCTLNHCGPPHVPVGRGAPHPRLFASFSISISVSDGPGSSKRANLSTDVCFHENMNVFILRCSIMKKKGMKLSKGAPRRSRFVVRPREFFERVRASGSQTTRLDDPNGRARGRVEGKKGPSILCGVLPPAFQVFDTRGRSSASCAPKWVSCNDMPSLGASHSQSPACAASTKIISPGIGNCFFKHQHNKPTNHTYTRWSNRHQWP
ncbi:hypothetical protein BDP55DRAFT_410306 [Colletotrichum godetiae]|uniref:Uncharacterized protein n=1 Tax=Colletotrichum godetiae TaxID=1209918 RepID=A0AAJ0EX55_9PEZI|nr:uncharacterized protein BDP55DRAFT_410306 [Colletotrichum godetiae]KAK1689500.1 hypothetical protein BDP55DRAFT_410306 [Colletotrichum godetiae]